MTAFTVTMRIVRIDQTRRRRTIAHRLRVSVLRWLQAASLAFAMSDPQLQALLRATREELATDGR